MMNTKLLIFLFALLALAACQTSTTSTNGNSVDSTTKVADAINAPLLADSMPPPATSTPTIPVNCGKSSITTFGGINVWKLDSSKTICFKAGMAIDADGSPNAYCPDNKGLDYTANAGHPAANGEPADWFGVVVDAQKNPVVQKAGDPHPGCYVAATSLQNNLASSDPKKYVDAETIPYIALPKRLLEEKHLALGDFVYIKNTSNGKTAYAIFADVGGNKKIGEGSIYLAKQLGIANTSPRNGGIGNGIVYILFPGTGIGNGKLRTVQEINEEGANALNKLGGQAFVDGLGF